MNHSAAHAIAIAVLMLSMSTPCAAAEDVNPAAQRVADRFETFAGSPQNAQSLVQGLRTGAPITLTSPPPSSSPIGGVTLDSVVFTPATRPMGYGNIARALMLAQRELASRGVAHPTPGQLRIVLMGGTLNARDGTTVRTPGVLQLRSAHMGWGQIAHALSVSPTRRPTTKAPAPADGDIVTGTDVLRTRHGTSMPGGLPTTSRGAIAMNTGAATTRADDSARTHAVPGRF